MTQQYTPVSWQDETTSQQGTLINAERLNQMQTAHHYADGFKEVDAVPTADPGTDYHQVVFCTADTTFYRWTGTEWVKDVDDSTAQELHEFEAQTATDLAGKLDKITGGGSDIGVYSHQGSTQGQTLAIASAVANSIALRDNNAGLHAQYSELGFDGTDVVNRTALNNATTDIWQGINGKADKATTLAGYNIGDAYTKSQMDSALADKVGIIPVTTGVKFYAQSSGGTSLYQGTANAQTGITSVPMRDSNGRIKTATPSADEDAAPKKYVDDGLALKADTTALTDGSVTKIGTSNVGTDTKPIKLVGGVPTAVADALATQTYVSNALDGYLPMVRTTGNQDISGIKKLTGRSVNAGQIMSAPATAVGKWFKVATMPKQAGAVSRSVLYMFDNAAYSTGWWGLFMMTFGATTYLPYLRWIMRNPAWTSDIDSVAVGSNGSTWEIWLRSNVVNHRAAITLVDMCSEVINQEYSLTLIDPSDQTEAASPTSDSTINYIVS